MTNTRWLITTPVKDVKNLQNNLSITQRLQMTQECFEWHDLLDPFNIVFPQEENKVALTLENSTVKYLGIFKHHKQISCDQVAASCKHYQKYVTFPDANGKNCTFAKELAWSYNHFRNHVDPSLHENVNREFRQYKSLQQGGPLFLKILLDHLTVSSVGALIITTTTYGIKTMSKGEDIIEVIKLLSSITGTIIAIRDDKEHPLLEHYIQKLLNVFQMTSVNPFNASFAKLQEELVLPRMRLRIEVPNQ